MLVFNDYKNAEYALRLIREGQRSLGAQPGQAAVEFDHRELEQAIGDQFKNYWWLGEKAGRQLAAAALCGLNDKGFLFWRFSPKQARLSAGT